MPIPLVGFANLAHMGAYHYMPACFVKLSFKFKKKKVTLIYRKNYFSKKNYGINPRSRKNSSRFCRHRTCGNTMQ